MYDFLRKNKLLDTLEKSLNFTVLYVLNIMLKYKTDKCL